MHHIDLDAVVLQKGNHSSLDQGACLMEMVAAFADEPHSDRPVCASPVLTAFGISLNDQWGDADRQLLKPFIPRLVGTRDGQDEARSFLALDWLIRTYTPAWLDLVPALAPHAAALRDHRRIVDLVAAQSAGTVVRAARTDAAAARDAARDAAGAAAGDAAGAAAGAAAWDAARAAAWDAAWDAAGDAAWDAAWDAAGAAAGAAAWDAAGAKLQPTVDILKTSALDLFSKMIDPGRAQES